MRSKIRIFSLPLDRYRSRGKRGCLLWMMTSRPQYVPLLIFSLRRPVTGCPTISDLIPRLVSVAGTG